MYRPLIRENLKGIIKNTSSEVLCNILKSRIKIGEDVQDGDLMQIIDEEKKAACEKIDQA